MKNLRVLREAAGYSQQDIAHKLGVKVQLISAIETGKTSLPPKYFTTLAKTLKVKEEYFIKQNLKNHKAWLLARMAQ